MTLPFPRQNLYVFDELVGDPGFTRPARPQLFRNKQKHGQRRVARHVENEKRSVTRLNLSVSVRNRTTAYQTNQI